MKSSTDPIRTDNIAMMPDEKERMIRASDHKKAAKHLVDAASNHTQASEHIEAGNHAEAEKNTVEANQHIEAALLAHKALSKEYTVKS